MKKHIPNTKKALYSFNSNSYYASKLYNALKSTSNFLRKIKTPNNKINIELINKTIDDINDSTEIEFFKINNTNSLIQDIKEIHKVLYTARQIENNTAHRERIQQHIQNRYDNFSTNITKMIDSVLHRHTDHVHFDNIKTENELITNPVQIQLKINTHFENWTKSNPYNQDLWAQWENEYIPRKEIQSNWYDTLQEDITLTELKECIKSAPTHKATGPQHISNKKLKHLNDTTLAVLLHILNSCLQIQNIPAS